MATATIWPDRPGYQPSGQIDWPRFVPFLILSGVGTCLVMLIFPLIFKSSIQFTLLTYWILFHSLFWAAAIHWGKCRNYNWAWAGDALLFLMVLLSWTLEFLLFETSMLIIGFAWTVISSVIHVWMAGRYFSETRQEWLRSKAFQLAPYGELCLAAALNSHTIEEWAQTYRHRSFWIFTNYSIWTLYYAPSDPFFQNDVGYLTIQNFCPSMAEVTGLPLSPKELSAVHFFLTKKQGKYQPEPIGQAAGPASTKPLTIREFASVDTDASPFAAPEQDLTETGSQPTVVHRLAVPSPALLSEVSQNLINHKQAILFSRSTIRPLSWFKTLLLQWYPFEWVAINYSLFLFGMGAWFLTVSPDKNLIWLALLLVGMVGMTGGMVFLYIWFSKMLLRYLVQPVPEQTPAPNDWLAAPIDGDWQFIGEWPNPRQTRFLGRCRLLREYHYLLIETASWRLLIPPDAIRMIAEKVDQPNRQRTINLIVEIQNEYLFLIFWPIGYWQQDHYQVHNFLPKRYQLFYDWITDFMKNTSRTAKI